MTFAWIYVATGIFYFGYQILSGNYRQSLFVPKDLAGVWPMMRHYFFFGRKPAANGSLQPASEDGLHLGDFARPAIDPDGNRALQSRTVFLLGFADGRLSLGSSVAFRCALRVAPIRLGTPDHGDLARLEQFHIHADGLEARPGILALTIVRSCQKRCKIENGTKRKL